MIQRLKLMAEYGGTVLWWVNLTGVGPADPDALPISSGLRVALREWADAYDQTLNQEYPPDSGFSTPEAELDFEIEGRRLWKELQVQLGDEYKVLFFSTSESQLMG